MRKKLRMFIGQLLILVLFSPAMVVHAGLHSIESLALDDSEEPYLRRIYSYDMGIDSVGNVHVVYTKPIPGSDNAAQVIYRSRTNGSWGNPRVLSNNAWAQTISTRLLIDASDRIHVSYINMDDNGGPYLAYQLKSSGFWGLLKQIGPGGWHSRMQLNEQQQAIFMREGESWPERQSQLILYLTDDNESWYSNPLNVSTSGRFTIGEFLYHSGQYHVTYGDGTIVKKVLSGIGLTEYKDGIFHNFHYASSLDGINWEPKVIDTSGTLYEKEFWTSLMIHDGTPLVSFFKYSEYANKFASGASCLMARLINGKWRKQIIAGLNFLDSRAGMGAQLAADANGKLLGVWDDSPDRPINFHGGADATGSIAMQLQGQNEDWDEKVLLEPFSAEGIPRIAVRGDSLFLLVLGDWTNVKLYFREYSLQALPPAVDLPQLVSPANGSTVEDTFSMEWNGVPQAEFYHMYLYKDGDMYHDGWRSAAPDISYRVEPSLPVGQYEWWVQSFIDGVGYWSSSSLYQVGKSGNMPLPSSSVKASKGEFKDVLIAWAPSNFTESYEIWRHVKNIPFAAKRIASNIKGFAYQDTSMEEGMKYYYWVKSVHGGTTSGFGEPVSGFADFSKKTSSLPLTPLPVSGDCKHLAAINLLLGR